MTGQSLAQSQASGVYAPIYEARDTFNEIAARTGVDFAKESVYACQILMGNDFLAKIARQNPTSLKLAMVNVATIGLTLNPNRQLAFLVPRKGKVTYDISYRGLLQLAKQNGAIKWAKVELVYANDAFEPGGPNEVPMHKFDPFADPATRGEFRGGYCVAKLPDGEFQVEYMSAAEITAVESMSEQEKYSAWKGPFRTQMIKKAILKRASNMWINYHPTHSVFERAVSYLNENGDGINFDARVIDAERGEARPLRDEDVSEEQIELLDRILARAVESKAWSAARDYIPSQIPEHLHPWALNKLAEAEARHTEVAG